MAVAGSLRTGVGFNQVRVIPFVIVPRVKSLPRPSPVENQILALAGGRSKMEVRRPSRSEVQDSKKRACQGTL